MLHIVAMYNNVRMRCIMKEKLFCHAHLETLLQNIRNQRRFYYDALGGELYISPKYYDESLS